jgi:hypothetical protein
LKIYKTNSGKDFSIVPHCLERMSERQIKVRDIAFTLDNHHTEYNDREGNSCQIADLNNGKRLRIVVAENSNPLRVITAIVLDQ